jgi:predicted DNA-binding protein (MmcQ/YjbR family)
MNDVEKIRQYCMTLPGATEDIKWQKDLVFSVAGKMFAAINTEPPHDLGFKVTPEEFAELTLHEGIFPAPYMAKHHWITFNDHRVISFTELKRLLRQSHQMTVAKLPKKLRERLADTSRR